MGYFHFLCNERGETLITVMVAAGLSAILAVGAASQFSNMSKDQKRMTQKFDIMETRGLLTGFLSDIDSCSCQLKNRKLILEKNGTYVVPGILQLKTSCAASALHIVKVDEPLPGGSSGVEVNAIGLHELRPTGNSNEFFGHLAVDFKSSSTIGTFAPAKGPIVVVTNDELEIQICSSLTSTAASLMASSTELNSQNGNGTGGYFTPKTCQPNELFSGLDSKNKAICKPMPSCTNNQMLMGVDTEGRAVCQDIPTCKAGQIFSHVNSDGQAVCYDNPNCPGGFAVKEIRSDGSVDCIPMSSKSAPQSPQDPPPPPTPLVTTAPPPAEPPPSTSPSVVQELKCDPGQIKQDGKCIQTYKVIDIVRSAVGFKVLSVGTYDRCVLRKRSGDLESTSYCELIAAGNSWSVRIEDEGNKAALNCHITCTSKNTVDVPSSTSTTLGTLCSTSKGGGIIVAGSSCCSGTKNGQRLQSPPKSSQPASVGMAGLTSNTNSCYGVTCGMTSMPVMTQISDLQCK